MLNDMKISQLERIQNQLWND